MKWHDSSVTNSLEITGSLIVPIIDSTGSLMHYISTGSLFFNKQDNKLYVASGSRFNRLG